MHERFAASGIINMVGAHTIKLVYERNNSLIGKRLTLHGNRDLLFLQEGGITPASDAIVITIIGQVDLGRARAFIRIGAVKNTQDIQIPSEEPRKRLI
jgi:hypothetical protein